MAAPKWDAALYDSKHAFVSEKAKGLVDLLAAKPGERVLDLGCGTGTLSAEIAASGERDAAGDDGGEDAILDVHVGLLL